jgi:glycosyltransferase involved in cell wall biosynthesis
MGLAFGLSRLSGEGERYVFLTQRSEADWLAPVIGGDCELVELDTPHGTLRRIAGSLWRRGLPRAARAVSAATDLQPARVVSDVGAQVVHGIHQAAFTTTARRIYQPHDLQHLHFPDFFAPAVAKRRDHLYRLHCRRADMVVVMTRWGREDLVRHYGVDERKVFVIPWPAPTHAYGHPADGDVERVRRRWELPDRYVLYPAQTWPHKNHLGLVRALRLMVDDGLDDVTLVCTGHLGPHFPVIEREARTLGVRARTRFLGWVPSEDMLGIYRGARGVVFPSLFEGWGMPVMESFHLGIPVACSRIPVLQEQAGDAAAYFDPNDPRDLAAAVATVWTDDALRARLSRAGAARAAALDWTTIAEAFRAHYRRLAGHPLSDRDGALIDRSFTGAWLPPSEAVEGASGSAPPED